MLLPKLPDAKVLIWGLGLMGGSMALALSGKCRELFGLDIDDKTLKMANDGGIVDRISKTPEEFLPDVDVIIMAMPVGEILSRISLIGQHCNQPVLVMDVGSTKKDIVEAYNAFPSNINAVGGHPMCGKPAFGLENADPELYQDTPFMLSPAMNCSKYGLSLAEEIVRALGAVPLLLDPEIHDRWVAGTSHLPYLINIALALTVPEEFASMIGPGFSGATRLAQKPTSMMLDILKTNNENILEMVRAFEVQLNVLAKLLKENDFEELDNILKRAAMQREQSLSALEDFKKR